MLDDRSAAILGLLLERVREAALNEPGKLAQVGSLNPSGQSPPGGAWLSESWTALVDLCIRRISEEESLEDAEERLVARNIGVMLASHGLTLQESLSALMMLRRIAMESLRLHSAAEKLSAQFVVTGINHIALGWNDFMLSVSEGHLAAELENKSRLQAGKDAFVLSALQGGGSRVELHTNMEAYGIDRSAKYLAFRLRPGREEDWAGILQYFERDVESAHRNAMTTIIDGDLCGFSAELPHSEQGVLIGMSSPVSLSNLPSAFRSASRAFSVAARLGLSGHQSLGDLGLVPAVVMDRDVHCALTNRYIRPVEDYGEFGQTLLVTIDTYVQEDCNLSSTAEALKAHENTVRQRLAKFKDIVGYDFRSTSVLAELWWLLQSRRTGLTVQVNPAEEHPNKFMGHG